MTQYKIYTMSVCINYSCYTLIVSNCATLTTTSYQNRMLFSLW